jgi:hypothetical protein
MIGSWGMIWVSDVAHTPDMRNTYKILVCQKGRKKLLGRLKRRWEDNINMDLEE